MRAGATAAPFSALMPIVPALADYNAKKPICRPE